MNLVRKKKNTTNGTPWQVVSGLMIIITVRDSSFAHRTDLQALYHMRFFGNSWFRPILHKNQPGAETCSVVDNTLLYQSSGRTSGLIAASPVFWSGL